MPGIPERRCRRRRGTPTGASSSGVATTVAAVATAAVAAVLPIYHHGPLSVCGYKAPPPCLAFRTATASCFRTFGHSPPARVDAGVTVHDIGSRSGCSWFSCDWPGGDGGGGGAGSLRFRRRRRSDDVLSMMVAYNPNDELRAIVQRKQHEIKAFLKQHTAEDDRLQVWSPCAYCL